MVSPYPNTVDEEWVFPNETNRVQDYATHNFFRYFGKLPPTVVSRILDYALPLCPPGPVIDLMCGSGTTMVECMLRGVPSVGNDVNDLSLLVSRVKTTPLVSKKLRSYLNDILWAYHSATPQQRDAASAYVPNMRNRAYWFSEAVCQDLSLLRMFIEPLRAADPPYGDFFFVAWLGIIRRVSTAATTIGRIFRDVQKQALPVVNEFAKKASDMIDRMQSFCPKTDAVELYNYDARSTALASNHFSFALIHPPYFALYKYSSDVLRFELEWGGFNRKQIAAKEIRDGFKTTDIGLFEDFVQDLIAVTLEGIRVVQPGGLVCVVVNNSTLRNERLPVTDRLIEGVTQHGIALYRHVLRKVLYSSQRYHRSARDDIKTEQDHVIFFRA